MFYSREKSKGKYTFTNLGALCPKCHRVDPVGDIALKLEVRYDQQAPISQIRVHAPSALNLDYESHGVRRLVNVYCVDCGTRMILVDREIGEILRDLNQLKLFTQYSCYGHPGSGNSELPYITFYPVGQLIHQFNLWLGEKYHVNLKPIEDSGGYILDCSLSEVVPFHMSENSLDLLDFQYPNDDAIQFNQKNRSHSYSSAGMVQEFWKEFRIWLYILKAHMEEFIQENMDSNLDERRNLIQLYVNCLNSDKCLAEAMERWEKYSDYRIKGETDIEIDEF